MRMAFEEAGISREPSVPVSGWLGSYGTDAEYPSRRTRRITERAYRKVGAHDPVAPGSPCGCARSCLPTPWLVG